MLHETELTESEFKEGAPGGVIGVMKIQDVWNVVANVQKLNGGGRDWMRGSYVEGIQVMVGGGGSTGRRRGRAMRHGQGERKAAEE
jgi:hypothetical protein